MEVIKSAVDLLQTGGPYAIVVFLAVAYYRKDQQLTNLYRELIGMVEGQTSAATKMESALVGLRDAFNAFTASKR